MIGSIDVKRGKVHSYVRGREHWDQNQDTVLQFQDNTRPCNVWFLLVVLTVFVPVCAPYSVIHFLLFISVPTLQISL